MSPTQSYDSSNTEKGNKNFVPSIHVDELSMDQALLKRLNEVVNENLRNDQFSVEDLANEVALSRSHLHRKLQKLTGQSISQFIRSIRLDHALGYLKKDVGTVSEIAFRVGFGSSTYFIKCFSEHFGYSPGEVKNRDYASEQTHKSEHPQVEEINPVPSRPINSPLESFHPTSSDTLIDEIFDELVKNRPTLAKYLMVEDDEVVDKRILAYQIIKTYPWPIGVEIRRLFSVSLKNKDQKRVDQIKNTVQKIIRLCAYTVVCELIQLLDQKISLKIEKEIIRKCLSHFSEENILNLFTCVQSVINQNEENLSIQEICEFLEDDSLRELAYWIEMNREENVDLSSATESFEQSLVFFLKKSAFLARYRLVNVGRIEVEKRRFKKPSYHHLFRLLNSSDSDFKAMQEDLISHSDSHAVILIKTLKNADHYLNLSPFIVHTEAQDFEKGQIKRTDLYMLQESNKEKLMYVGTEVSELQSLSGLKDYQSLIEEYFTILNLFDKL